MGLHRLYWIPEGFDAGDGAYVQYRPRRCTPWSRSRRSRAGDGRGRARTSARCPTQVRTAMAHDGMLRSWVFQFETSARTRSRRPPSGPGLVGHPRPAPFRRLLWAATTSTTGAHRGRLRPRQRPRRRADARDGEQAWRCRLASAPGRSRTGRRHRGSSCGPVFVTWPPAASCSCWSTSRISGASATAEPPGHRPRGRQLAPPGGAGPSRSSRRCRRGRTAPRRRRAPRGPDTVGPTAVARGMSGDRAGLGPRVPTPLLIDDDLYLFNEGTHRSLADKLGRPSCCRGTGGATSSRSGPPTPSSVAGDRGLQRLGCRRRPADALRGDSGIWEGTVRAARPGDVYKFAITTRDGERAREGRSGRLVHRERRPSTGSVVWDLAYAGATTSGWRPGASGHALDAPDLRLRGPPRQLAARRRPDPGRCSATRRWRRRSIEHVRDAGVHPRRVPAPDGASLLRVVGIPDHRVLRPHQPLRQPAGPHGPDRPAAPGRHRRASSTGSPRTSPTTPSAWRSFDGTHLYEHADPRLGVHPDWNSLIFNYGRHEVRSFLASSAEHWLSATTSTACASTPSPPCSTSTTPASRGSGCPTRTEDARTSRRCASCVSSTPAIYADHPDVQVMAEESTAWPGVSRPVDVGGLGFGFKWDMGWMHDTLVPVRRPRPPALPPRRAHLPAGLRLHRELRAARCPTTRWSTARARCWPRCPATTGSSSPTSGCCSATSSANRARSSSSWDPSSASAGNGTTTRASTGPCWAARPTPGVSRWVADLNRLYRAEPPVARARLPIRPGSSGCRWTTPRQPAQLPPPRTLRAVRCWSSATSPRCPVTNVPVGVPEGGSWLELLNSDAADYGGSGVGNLGGVEADPVAWRDRPTPRAPHGAPVGVRLLPADPACEPGRPGGRAIAIPSLGGPLAFPPSPTVTCRLGVVPVPGQETHVAVWAPKSATVSVRILGDPARLVPLRSMEAATTADRSATCRRGPGTATYSTTAESWPTRRRAPSPTACTGPQRCSTRPPPLGRRRVPWPSPCGNTSSMKPTSAPSPRPEPSTRPSTPSTSWPTWASPPSSPCPWPSSPAPRNWGYDGVFPLPCSTPTAVPPAFQRFVDACHQRGLAVVLDVVYNHLGPEGNVLAAYGPYFTDRYRTPWGPAINFDGPGSDQVRRYFVENALNGSETSTSTPSGSMPSTASSIRPPARSWLELSEATEQLGTVLGRRLELIAESADNDPRVVSPVAVGGLGMDAQWNDDFHHALHATLTGERLGYYADFGDLGQLARAMSQGFVYQGQFSALPLAAATVPPRPGSRRSDSCSSPRTTTTSGTAPKVTAWPRSWAPGALRLAAAVFVVVARGAACCSWERSTASPRRSPISSTTAIPNCAEAVRRGRAQEMTVLGWTDETADPLDERHVSGGHPRPVAAVRSRTCRAVGPLPRLAPAPPGPPRLRPVNSARGPSTGRRRGGDPAAVRLRRDVGLCPLQLRPRPRSEAPLPAPWGGARRAPRWTGSSTRMTRPWVARPTPPETVPAPTTWSDWAPTVSASYAHVGQRDGLTHARLARESPSPRGDLGRRGRQLRPLLRARHVGRALPFRHARVGPAVRHRHRCREPTDRVWHAYLPDVRPGRPLRLPGRRAL